MGIFNRMARSLSDEEIVELYWQRDESAISHTDIKYRRYLFTVSYNILGSNEDSEECINDTYIGTWNAIPPERPSCFKAFLTTIMRRVSINKYNELTRKKRVPSALTDSLSDLEDFMADNSFENEENAKILGEIINNYVKGLSQRQRYIFMSRYYVAEPIETIAHELSVSVSTVKKDIAAIKTGLKEALEKEGFTV